MTALSHLVHVHHRNVRAVNLEHDLGDPEVLDGYAVGEHIIDATRRVLIGCQDGARTRAWSITGPYGVGKSSFAHFICSLLGPSNSPAFRMARGRLRAVDAQLADTLTRERRRIGLAARGAVIAAVTAEREPIQTALARALAAGAERYWRGPGRNPGVVEDLHVLAGAGARKTPAGEKVLRALDELCVKAPVVIVIDELGKTLEYAANRSIEGDLFVLQQIAERFSAAAHTPGCILTLQHLAFEDYLAGASEVRRGEWRKVHGRFEDIPFISTGAHASRLIATAIKPPSGPHSEQITSACARAYAASGLPVPDVPAQHYPLHPLASATLPALTARLGQHDRSLVAFLTSDAPHGLPAFLEHSAFEDSSIPFLRTHDVYRYFFEDSTVSTLPGADGTLAREITTRVTDASGLGELEQDVLKTIGVLNIVSGTEGVIANAATIEEALVGPDGDVRSRRRVRHALASLTDKSILTYRDFAGEYRVWQGSDFDVVAQLRAARERLVAERPGDEDLLDMVAAARPLRPLVAQRHSQATGTLRYFESRYASEVAEPPPQSTLEDAAGLILYVLAGGRPPRELPGQTTDGRPLIVVWSARGAEIREAALDVGAAIALLANAPELESDPVARREVRHRLEAAQSALAELIAAALADPDVSWYQEGERRKPGGRLSFSRLLSEICDREYPQTPAIANETLNRHELTSQGAKARRELLERMFTHETQERLAIEGFGPERAMYEAVLHETGLHDEHAGEWRFSPPPADSPLAAVWSHIEEFLDSAVDSPREVSALFDSLAAPPFGMKQGPLPVLLAAALQYRSDDVFVYQEGTFCPVVDPMLIERLLKAPERFTVKRAALIGVRAQVFETLRDLLGSSASPAVTRNATTLSIVRPLIALASALPPYSTSTSHIGARARSICSALLSAREPDELLFVELPAACELAPFNPALKDSANDRVAEYVARLRAGLAELSAAYLQLVDRIGSLLCEAFDIPGGRAELREHLRVRSELVREHVIEPRMRAMLLAASERNGDEQEWLETLGMTLSGKSPSTWSDQDLVAFEASLAERSAAFKRLELLHFELSNGRGRAFDSRRVTVTAPDGSEAADLVSVDAVTRERISDALDGALQALQETFGSTAKGALLGVLAERLLCEQNGSARADTQTRKASTG